MSLISWSSGSLSCSVTLLGSLIGRVGVGFRLVGWGGFLGSLSGSVTLLGSSGDGRSRCSYLRFTLRFGHTAQVVDGEEGHRFDRSRST